MDDVVVVLAPSAQAFGKLLILADVETAERTLLILSVAQPAFGTRVGSIGTRITQGKAVAAYPTFLTGRNANHQSVVADVLGHHSAGANNRVDAQ